MPLCRAGLTASAVLSCISSVGFGLGVENRGLDPRCSKTPDLSFAYTAAVTSRS